MAQTSKHKNDMRLQMQQLIEDIHELEALQDGASVFNIFESVGLARQEIRHSHFLAFLLNPSAAHGLGGGFLRRFLTRICLDSVTAEEGGLSAADIICADWEGTQVFRERHHIDILLQNDTDKIVILIENKVGSYEHGNQLERYREWCKEKFPGYRQLYVYLSPHGSDPSDKAYVIATYEQVVLILEKALQLEDSRFSQEMTLTLRHYIRMVRRYILQEDPLKETAQKLYRKYKLAFDYIYESKPNANDEIYAMMHEIVAETPTLDHVGGQQLLHCFPKVWWEVPALCSGTSWSRNMLVNIEVDYRNKDLMVCLWMGGGPEEYRQRIHHFVITQSAVMSDPKNKLNREYTRLFKKKLLDHLTIATGDCALMREELWENWRIFKEEELPVITRELQGLFEPLQAL